MGPIHTGRGATRNKRTQIMGVFTQVASNNQRVCVQTCLRVLCEQGLEEERIVFGGGGFTLNSQNVVCALSVKNTSSLYAKANFCLRRTNMQCIFQCEISVSQYGEILSSVILIAFRCAYQRVFSH